MTEIGIRPQHREADQAFHDRREGDLAALQDGVRLLLGTYLGHRNAASPGVRG